MKKLLLVLLLPLNSCFLFEATDYEPAIRANSQQAASYAVLHSAFVAVVQNSKNATDDQKTKALADIEANRNQFMLMNNALQNFLSIAGDVKPDRLLEIAEKVYDKVKEK